MQSDANKADLSTAVRKALYASKICSYAQGLNIIRAKSISMGWNIEMGELTRIWKVCNFACYLFACNACSWLMSCLLNAIESAWNLIGTWRMFILYSLHWYAFFAVAASSALHVMTL